MSEVELLEEELKQRDLTIATIIRKFQKADDERLAFKKENEKLHETVNRLKKYEIKNVELERNIEQLKIELDSLKQTETYKKLYSDGELSIVCKELMKWKNEMKQINNKVVEQNKLIQLLVKKCEVLKNERVNIESNQQTIDSPIVFNQSSNSTVSTPSSSLAYETMDEFSATPTIITNENLIQVYQCPKCKIEISNDIDFKVFTDHVDNCSPDKLVCVFCLKFFDKRNNDEFVQHVSNH
jgi:hypothetical protein